MNPYTRIKDLEDRVEELEELGHELLHTTEDLLVQFDDVLAACNLIMRRFEKAEKLAPKKKPGRPRKTK